MLNLESVPEVVITEFMHSASVEELRDTFDTVYEPTLAEEPEHLAVELAEARALVVRNRTIVAPATLDAAPQLRIVARLGVGLDNIDVDACSARGVEVAPAVGANAIAVAEYVLGALFVLFRGAFGLTGRVAEGEWPRDEAVGRELTGLRLGLVGYGSIAREVASRAKALGMSVAAHDPYLAEDDEAWASTERAELARLMSTCDAVSIHVPLDGSTSGLISHELIGSMRPGAVLVNTARGGIVDEDAVVDGLKSGRLRGAALDVFGSEPVGADYGARFSEAPNLILTPHIAGITEESEARIGALTVSSVKRALGAVE